MCLDKAQCPCGRALRSIQAVEGRLQDVMLLRDSKPVFPFELNAIVLRHVDASTPYTITQHDFETFTLAIDDAPKGLAQELAAALEATPTIAPFQPEAAGGNAGDSSGCSTRTPKSSPGTCCYRLPTTARNSSTGR